MANPKLDTDANRVLRDFDDIMLAVDELILSDVDTDTCSNLGYLAG